MASLPGETGGGSPEFGIDPLAIESPCYDPHEIADEAVWPLVSKLWGEEWREFAIVGQHLEIPKMSTLESGEMYNICLSASQSLSLESEAGDSPYNSTAVISLEKFVCDPLRATMVERITQQRTDEFEAFDIGTLIVKDCVSYTFSTNGEADIDPYNVIEEPYDGNQLWYSTSEDQDCDEENDERSIFDEEVRFRDHDLDQLIMAFRILEAPDDLINTLEYLKQAPIKSDGV